MWALFQSRDEKYYIYGHVSKVGTEFWMLDEYYGAKYKTNYKGFDWFHGDIITLFFTDWELQYELNTRDLHKVRSWYADSQLPRIEL